MLIVLTTLFNTVTVFPKVTSEEVAESGEQSYAKSTVKKAMLSIKHPTPQAIGKMEEYITQHRLRLVDMFTRMDKNKDWLISCSDCRQVFRKLQVPITDGEVDELISALDRNNDGHLDYRELLKGRLTYRLEKRQKKKNAEDESTVEFSPHKTVQSPQYFSVPDTCTDSNMDDGMCSTGSTPSDSEDVRQQKRGKMRSKQKNHIGETKRSLESTQSIRMKQHIATSTLPKPTAQRVDHYRQEELKQFQNLLLYCRTHGIVLNQSLLERGELTTKAYGELLLVSTEVY